MLCWNIILVETCWSRVTLWLWYISLPEGTRKEIIKTIPQKTSKALSGNSLDVSIIFPLETPMSPKIHIIVTIYSTYPTIYYNFFTSFLPSPSPSQNCFKFEGKSHRKPQLHHRKVPTFWLMLQTSTKPWFSHGFHHHQSWTITNHQWPLIPWDFPQQWPLIPWDFPTAPQGSQKTQALAP